MAILGESMHDQQDNDVAELFNSAVAAFAISGAWEVGLLDAVAKEPVDISAFCTANRLHEPSIASMVDVLSYSRILKNDDKVSPGTLFEGVFSTKGFFHWLTRGSVQVFSEWPELSHEARREDGFIHRDGAAIAVACRDMGYHFFNKPFYELLDEITFSNVADLGCGSAERLITMASSRPTLHGVGVDISSQALSVAADSITEAGLQSRLSLVEADARNLSHKEAFDGVDLVTCFLMGHDFWPRSTFVDSFLRLREAFPDVQNLVLCDTYRSERTAETRVPVFTYGFEIGHAVMGQYVPTLEEWMEGFDDAGWTCIERRAIETPAYTSLFVLQPKL